MIFTWGLKMNEIGLLICERLAWQYARECIHDAYEFKDPGLRKYCLDSAQWFRSQAKKFRNARKGIIK